MVSAYLNQVVTAVPPHDVHEKFLEFCPSLLPERRERALFRRMALRSQIDHRYSFLAPHADKDKLDSENFYDTAGFPDTQTRMAFYERHAFTLARRALDNLDLQGTTHLLLTTCTGFYAPGLDYEIVHHYGLSPAVERTMVGFMGCFAALNALKLARHIVRSESDAKVLVVNLELCTLHMKPRGTLEEMLSFLIFSDGCAASIITARPEGIELEGFSTSVIPSSGDQITWRIGEMGFDMNLSGQVPLTIAANLPEKMPEILGDSLHHEIDHWAIHPGGRTILDAVREGADLREDQLAASREVLRCYGNMSSASVMFVMAEMLRESSAAGHRTAKGNRAKAHGSGKGRALAFGPGLTVESMRFRVH